MTIADAVPALYLVLILSVTVASVFEIYLAGHSQQHGTAILAAAWGMVGIGLLTWVAYDSGLFGPLMVSVHLESALG